MIFLFDSSAVLAAILDEPGGNVAHDAMGDGHISIVNLCEVLSKLTEAGIEVEAARAMVGRFELRVRAFREGHAFEIARLRPLTIRQGLSFGDRACLAHARIEQLPVMTADRRWAELDLGIDIRLIR